MCAAGDCDHAVEHILIECGDVFDRMWGCCRIKQRYYDADLPPPLHPQILYLVDLQVNLY